MAPTCLTGSNANLFYRRLRWFRSTLIPVGVFAVRKTSKLNKITLRTYALNKRKAIDAVVAEAAAQALAQNILKYIGGGSSIVAGYAATRGEIDVFPALSLLAGKGHTLCLPVVDHKESPLIFRAWKPGAKLIKSSYAIEIPESGETLVPDIIITPLLAFDAARNRLGYGAGYYDRTISQLRKANKKLQAVGVAYALQQVTVVPAESYDEKLDAVITEKDTA